VKGATVVAGRRCCHSRGSGNPVESSGFRAAWIPAFAGMTIKVEGLLEQLEIFTIHTLGLMHQYSIH
jgi:hypothetical protein